MHHHAKGAFTIDGRDASPIDWEGGQMSRTRFAKTFTGEIAGTSIVEATMLRLEQEGPAIYVGIERFDCVLRGRAGTFVLLHLATALGREQKGTWTIVAGSGTGELRSIRGHAEILPDHELALDYELDS